MNKLVLSYQGSSKGRADNTVTLGFQSNFSLPATRPQYHYCSTHTLVVSLKPLTASHQLLLGDDLQLRIKQHQPAESWKLESFISIHTSKLD